MTEPNDSNTPQAGGGCPSSALPVVSTPSRSGVSSVPTSFDPIQIAGQGADAAALAAEDTSSPQISGTPLASTNRAGGSAASAQPFTAPTGGYSRLFFPPQPGDGPRSALFKKVLRLAAKHPYAIAKRYHQRSGMNEPGRTTDEGAKQSSSKSNLKSQRQGQDKDKWSTDADATDHSPSQAKRRGQKNDRKTTDEFEDVDQSSTTRPKKNKGTDDVIASPPRSRKRGDH
ncbi:hypothetical protein EST38_g2085 [Candolleomyces aberdarensis]|uniref:Uncharacterized protein n=1 Tax=Candolleomyces aberdarensis TaxID=2316362 RepID=A0A4Q2DWW8_9AGAR|nr:hypothetical protein EST38_g2085 [Candolleomyces aberdarensis]